MDTDGPGFFVAMVAVVIINLIWAISVYNIVVFLGGK